MPEKLPRIPLSLVKMLERSPGAVGCGHCHRLGEASVACPVCSRPVCRSCASPAACPDPTAQSLRLGLGWRLRAVDDDGIIGVATSWTGHSRQVIELASRRVLSKLPGRFAGLTAAFGPASQLTYAGHDLDQNIGQSFVVSTPARQAHLGERINIGTVANVHDLAVSEDGRYAALATRSQMSSAVHVINLQLNQLIHTIDQAEQVHAVAVSGAADVLAVGLRGKVQFYRLRFGGTQDLGVRQFGTGDVAWLAFGRRHLALITTEGSEGSLTVLSFDGPGAPEQWRPQDLCETAPLSFFREDSANRRRIRASISPGGRLIAVREKKKTLQVISASDGACQTLAGHTDRINLVRFVRDGQLLVSADLDNRVILWPRLEVDDKPQFVADKIVKMDRIDL